MTWNEDPETRPGSDRQWWLTQGTEYCFVCDGSAHPETVSYCVACDRALCHFCLNNSDPEQEPFCPECARPGGSG